VPGFLHIQRPVFSRKWLHRIVTLSVFIILFLVYWLSFPDPLFDDSTSTVIEDSEGELLGAKIADDGQWRFPFNSIVPEKYEKAVILFEDRYFYYHQGVNPVSILRAFGQNIKDKKIVSGGSTLSMQVIRLSRKGRSRTIGEKMIEMILAIRMEQQYTKNEILALYASNAPFGGNVVGLDAASWRYFGRSPEDLSWAEASMLAVLPNSPALIHPGKNRALLLEKRNRLLDRLHDLGEMDSISCYLAKLEPLPEKPLPLPAYAPHLLSRVYLNLKGSRVNTTIDKDLQNRVTDIVETHHQILRFNEIHNAACIVLDVETGDVIAYVGNTSNPENPEYGSDVDIIMAPRSTGSILKPILYSLMLHHGEILPGTLIPDIPTHYIGYTPKNFSFTYDGAVPAKQALSRSLNIPSVRMLEQFSLQRFYYYLENLGMNTLYYPSDHYGLSLILGGAEGTLWDITGIFCSYARILKHYSEYDGKYDPLDISGPNFFTEQSKSIDKKKKSKELSHDNLINACSIWLTFQSLIEVNRPSSEYGWQSFSSSDKIAWKTGTSFGFRDGWAIGTTPEYTVGVWAGNADGEGRPGLTGVTAAAPILFDVFHILPTGSWFDPPLDELRLVPVCRQSGHRAAVNCQEIDSIWIPEAGLNSLPCPYHQIIHLTENNQYRVTSDCADLAEMKHVPWFVLPPVQEWYYQSRNPDYKPLPPMHPGCISGESIEAMDLIYPKHSARIYIPYELDGIKGQVVFEAAHRRSNTTIYWHLNNEYIGLTQHIHQLGITPEKGNHILTLVDEFGNVLEKRIEILDKEE